MRFRKVFAAALPCAALLAVGSLAMADDDHNPQSDQPIKIPAGTKIGHMSGSEAVKSMNAAKTSGGSARSTGGSTASFSLPVWSYSVTSSRDGRSYKGQIVGQNPVSGASASIPTYLIPVRLVFKYSSTTSYTFDPTAADTSCLGNGNTAASLTQTSPIFSSYPFTLATSGDDNTQYSDHFDRASFWTSAGNPGTSHTTLGGPIVEPVQTVTLTASNSYLANATVYTASGQCGNSTGSTNLAGYLGVVNINTWDPIAQSLIKSLGLNATELPVFLFYNAVMSQGRSSTLNNCCILGYHNAVGSPVQTYAVAEFEGRNQTLFTAVSDVSSLSHEINEWMQDPGGTNPSPAWGNVGQVSGCQSNYEVGDPLSGNLLPAISGTNGFSYHLQELAFFSWFYGGPSVAVNNEFSDNGTFKGAAKTCPPGGTN